MLSIIFLITAVSFQSNAWIEYQSQVDYIVQLKPLDYKKMSADELAGNIHQAEAYISDLYSRYYELRHTKQAIAVLEREIRSLKAEQARRLSGR